MKWSLAPFESCTCWILWPTKCLIHKMRYIVGLVYRHLSQMILQLWTVILWKYFKCTYFERALNVLWTYFERTLNVLWTYILWKKIHRNYYWFFAFEMPWLWSWNLIYYPSLNTQSCIRRPLCNTLKFENLRSLKWRIFSQAGKIGSGKNKKIFIFPTGLEDHLEDMFWV